MIYTERKEKKFSGNGDDEAMQRQMSLGRRIWKHRQAYLFLIPIFLFLGVFKYYTFLSAMVESLFQWNGANINRFIGLDNYVKLFQDKTFLTSLQNLLVFTLTNVVKSLTFPLIAAMMVYACKNRRVSNFFRLTYIVPMVVPNMVILLMWEWIYSYDTGALNQFLELIGLGSLKSAWLGSSSTALWSIIMIGFPFVGALGLQFLVYLGGLLNIPEEINESAQLDGITRMQSVWYIQLPMLRGQMKMFLMLAVINSLQTFENILVLTNGGPGQSTVVPALYMYNQAFTYGNMGYASAIGVVIFAICMVFTVINYKYIRTGD